MTAPVFEESYEFFEFSSSSPRVLALADLAELMMMEDDDEEEDEEEGAGERQERVLGPCRLYSLGLDLTVKVDGGLTRTFPVVGEGQISLATDATGTRLSLSQELGQECIRLRAEERRDAKAIQEGGETDEEAFDMDSGLDKVADILRTDPSPAPPAEGDEDSYDYTYDQVEEEQVDPTPLPASAEGGEGEKNSSAALSLWVIILAAVGTLALLVFALILVLAAKKRKARGSKAVEVAVVDGNGVPTDDKEENAPIIKSNATPETDF